MIPKIGTEIEVKVRNRLNVARYAAGVVRETETFRGTVYPIQKWQSGRRVVNLTTTYKWLPFREIELAVIVSINDTKVAHARLKEPETKVWVVTGSTGKKYTITETNGKRTCTCVGFGYHGYCKHVKMTKIS